MAALIFAMADPELAVAGAVGLLEQRGAHGGDDLPVAVERVNVAVRDAAAQVGVNVLQVLRLGAVNVAREVEVEVVLRVADLRHRHHARVARDFGQPREGVHDLVDVLGAEAVFLNIGHPHPFGVFDYNVQRVVDIGDIGYPSSM